MRKRIIWLVFFVLAVCLCLTWRIGRSGRDGGSVSIKVDLAEENHIREILRQRTIEHQGENQKMLEEFQKKLEAKGRFVQAEQNIRPFVEQVTSLEFSSKLCYRMVSDYLHDTTTALEMLSPTLMKHIILPCEQETSKIESELNAFLLQLQERDTQFKAGLTDFLKLRDISWMNPIWKRSSRKIRSSPIKSSHMRWTNC